MLTSNPMLGEPQQVWVCYALGDGWVVCACCFQHLLTLSFSAASICATETSISCWVQGYCCHSQGVGDIYHAAQIETLYLPAHTTATLQCLQAVS